MHTPATTRYTLHTAIINYTYMHRPISFQTTGAPEKKMNRTLYQCGVGAALQDGTWGLQGVPMTFVLLRKGKREASVSVCVSLVREARSLVIEGKHS